MRCGSFIVGSALITINNNSRDTQICKQVTKLMMMMSMIHAIQKVAVDYPKILELLPPTREKIPVKWASSRAQTTMLQQNTCADEYHKSSK